MKQLESQIAEWRAFVAAAPALDGRDVEELESHLREQINKLRATGLANDEAFLVAVKRMGALDALSREFAREHSDRLWKQLVLSSDEPQQRPAGSWLEAIGFAVGAAVAIQIARLAATSPFEMAAWFPRNLGFFVLPLLAGYLARTRRLDRRGWILTLAPFAVIGVLVNLYPYASRSDTEMLVTLHLPVVLWCALAIPYTGGKLTSHEGRMDFVRFTGEWVIYYTLIALGGAVLMALTALILNPLGSHVVENTIEWVLPSGAAGAVVVAAWLVEEKQQVVENMAPVLTMLFTPLFAVMLTMAAVSYAFSGVATEFDRGLLAVFDALLVVVLGLVVYAMSARDSSRSAGLMDVVQLV
ncbi:MAG: permease prefix domain 1-containing protein, partial [Actinomycetota bacterium]